eukprot:TRINITY_DN4335_c0_g1_i2.p1 TRINITY_DN4335_c0_g1~~TRINITY_DN4335_c0_g1_i2.p1  ORF type:complete len:512 (+),score=109.05 TRINITY_DN4335_c0_g1_i2:1-1536(+)
MKTESNEPPRTKNHTKKYHFSDTLQGSLIHSNSDIISDQLNSMHLTDELFPSLSNIKDIKGDRRRTYQGRERVQEQESIQRSVKAERRGSQGGRGERKGRRFAFESEPDVGERDRSLFVEQGGWSGLRANDERGGEKVVQREMVKEKNDVKEEKVGITLGSIMVVNKKNSKVKKNNLKQKIVNRNNDVGFTPVNPASSQLVIRKKKQKLNKFKAPTKLKKIILQERADEYVEQFGEPEIALDLSDKKFIMTPEREHVLKLKEIPNINNPPPIREYCDQIISKEWNEKLKTFLETIHRFQKKLIDQKTINYKKKRIYVVGLHEVKREAKIGRLKAVIMAPNIESISSDGGLDEQITKIMSFSSRFDIPVIYGLTRSKLAEELHIKGKVSVIGIFKTDNTNFNELIKEHRKLHKLYIIQQCVIALSNENSSLEKNIKEFELSEAIQAYENETRSENTNIGLRSKKNNRSLQNIPKDTVALFVHRYNTSYTQIINISRESTISDLKNVKPYVSL